MKATLHDDALHAGASDQPEAPAPRKRTHALAALALAVGAVLLAGGAFALGTLYGPGAVRTYLPSLARDLELLAPESAVEQLDDGYGGELARRVAAVGAELGRTAYTAPDLDEATRGTLEGLLASTDSQARYLDPETYAEAVEAAQETDGDEPKEPTVVEGVGVVTVDRLGTGSAEAVARELDDLASRGVAGIVLDLRRASGGSMNEAAAVASLFLNGGTVAEVIAHDGSVERLAADASSRAYTGPLAVLVSTKTAGATEALTAALQDHQRALVVGEVTAGVGTVPTVKTLSFGGAVSYAVAEFRTPDGYVVDGRGLAPDLVVPASTEDADDPESDGQLAAAVALVATWADDDSISVEGLTNAPGPQAEAVEQARALEEALRSAADGEVASPPERGGDGMQASPLSQGGQPMKS